MKILVVCQHYFPEPFCISDICEELVSRGHEVTVVTGLPNYPMGHIYDGYRHGEKRDEIVNGVQVHRCYTIGRRSGALWRFVNYYSFAISSTLYVSRLKDDFDVVFCYQLSPVMMASAAVKYKKKHNKKLILYCLDLWPESLTVGGVRQGSLLYKVFERVSGKIYKQVDKILVTSRSFADYFSHKFGVVDTTYLPQYADMQFEALSCNKESNDTVDIMFAGNVGAAQSIDTIIRAAALTKNVETLKWHIVGDGSELEASRKLASELNADNIVFHGRKPKEEMPAYYAMADAMLVTMKDDPVISMTLPGKVQSYMAAGKPVIGSIGGAAQALINEAECGLCGEPENPEQLAENVMKFISDSDKSRYSNNAIKYYEEYFSKDEFIIRLEKALKECL